MGLFSKKQPFSEIVPVTEMIVPRYSGEELERMVGETYEEKLKLQAKLKTAEAKLEAMGEIKAKLSSAEVFVDQCRRERDSEIAKREQVEREIKVIEQQRQRSHDREAVLQTQIDKLERDHAARDTDVRNALVRAMEDALIYENGGWSNNRVREFIDGFRDYVPEEGEEI